MDAPDEPRPRAPTLPGRRTPLTTRLHGRGNSTPGDRRVGADFHRAPGVQQTEIELHPVYLNHDALHHLIQAAGLILIFRAAGAACCVAAV